MQGIATTARDSARLVFHALKCAAHFQQFRHFLRDRREFLRQGGTIARYFPVVSDFKAKSGTTSGHYFHQDLLVARFIHEANPSNHLDIGSRIDGFVAHVAAFREIEVLDIRPQPACGHSNIRFRQADLMHPLPELAGAYTSVSCLHALEHFGLGRYSDRVSVNGHLSGFNTIAALVAPGGLLYLSVPVGRERVLFNAHRIFAPEQPVKWAHGFTLTRFDYVDDAGELHLDASPADAAGLRYGCGIYTLRRHTCLQTASAVQPDAWPPI